MSKFKAGDWATWSGAAGAFRGQVAGVVERGGTAVVDVVVDGVVLAVDPVVLRREERK